MILILAIILFIIFLIYSIRPRKSEEYTLEGLKLSWLNKAGIEGVVTKWIVTLKDSSGSVVHTYENNESKNLKNFTDVTMSIVNKKEFNDKIIGNNTLELYYNEVKPDTKLYTKAVTFTQDDFGMTLDTSNLEEIDIPEPPPPPITEIPHQIDSGVDGWCKHRNSVHQDVPGCGRICSDSNAVGRKDKGTWGSWDAYPSSVDCPDAKLDQVWKMEGGSRKLAVGKYSESAGLPDEIYMTGGKDGKYCVVDGDIIKCNKSAIGIGGLEKFKLTKNSDGTYSFKGDNKYCADEDDRIICNRGGIGGWEKFEISKNSDGTYSLKGGKGGKYCADEGNTIKCNRGGIGGWEKFKIGKYNKPSLSLRAGNSGAHDDGGGKVYFMDRHNIGCGSDALNGFGLIRQPDGRTQYNYLCLKPGHLRTHEKKTGSNWQGHNNGKVNSALYLDRHTVDCSDKPITQFRLHRDGDFKVYYKYKCGNVSTQNNMCRNTSTPWNEESDNVHYLDRHYAKCNPDEYMTKFRLVRDGKGNFRYNFRCCKKN